MRYSIGLDVGITSVGSAVVMLDGKDMPCRILSMGSRIFEVAENPKDGASLALPRREARSARMRLRRRRLRKERIRLLLAESKIVSPEEIAAIYGVQRELPDIYQFRCEALDRCLSKEEFVRLVIHLSQRCGFKSNRKVDTEDKKSNAGALTSAVDENNCILKEKGYRTIGEMLFRDEKFALHKRNKAESYAGTFSRQNYRDEIVTIFAAQRLLGNPYATEAFEAKYLEIYLSQRPFDAGPGAPSIYGGNQIEKMLGKCTFEPEETRAVKASFSAEYFNLLSKINAVRIVANGEKRALTEAERARLVALAFDKKALSYKSIRAALSLADAEKFNISYNRKDKLTDPEIEAKTKFEYLKAYHIFKKAYGSDYTAWSAEKRNDLAYALSVYKNDDKIRIFLSEHNFSDVEIAIAMTLPSFAKTANLSLKALNKIIPYLEQGLLYNEACTLAGYNFRADDKRLAMYLPAHPSQAPELEDIRNPVVRRAVSQTIKVINAIIRTMGESPVFLNIELARELSKSFKDRKDAEKSQEDNRAKNEGIMERLRSEFKLINPTGQDLVRFKLWTEQDGVCPYSLRRIELHRLFEPGYTDIDHIIPYSISFDDTNNNKVLVLSAENRQKGNRLPMEYLAGNKRDKFRIWVDNSNLRYRKKQNLLKEKLTEEDVEGFRQRNLTDTQYISRFLYGFISKYLQFAPNNTGRKRSVTAVNGGVTAYIRKRWGIQKIRENGDVHHAVDALVVACTTQGMINRIAEYSMRREMEIVHPETGEVFELNRQTGELTNRFPLPYPHFRKEIEIRCANDPARMLHETPLPNYSTDEPLEPIFVSRMPKHKTTGPAHKETVKRQLEKDGTTFTVEKVALTALNLKDGEIENYYNRTSDILLYNALKERLLQYGGNAAKAFSAPFYKPKSDGSDGPLVKKVKIVEKATLIVPVGKKDGNAKAVADNGYRVRTDVFYIKGEGYYLVPIYVHDTVKKDLPSRAIVAHKPYDQWKEMDDSNFVFSMYPNDLIKITAKDRKKFSLVNKNSTLPDTYETKEAFVYFKGTDISSASITVINHDNTYTIPSLGVKRLLSMEKYRVDPLGVITKEGKEKRMGFV